MEVVWLNCLTGFILKQSFIRLLFFVIFTSAKVLGKLGVVLQDNKHKLFFKPYSARVWFFCYIYIGFSFI